MSTTKTVKTKNRMNKNSVIIGSNVAPLEDANSVLQEKTSSRKRGRPHGSQSYIAVSLHQLNSLLQPDANVLVSRKFAEAISLKAEPLFSVPESTANESDLKPIVTEFTNENPSGIPDLA